MTHAQAGFESPAVCLRSKLQVPRGHASEALGSARTLTDINLSVRLQELGPFFLQEV